MSDPGNPMMPGNAPDMAGLIPFMEGAHQSHLTKLDKLKKAAGTAKVLREQLDGLVKLGDLVTTEDLVKAAAKLVGRGMEAEQIAGLLADAPQGGEALQGWIVKHDLALRENEKQLGNMINLIRHDTGVAGLRLLAAHAMQQDAGPSPIAGPASGVPTEPGTTVPSNDLMGQEAAPDA